MSSASKIAKRRLSLVVHADGATWVKYVTPTDNENHIRACCLGCRYWIQLGHPPSTQGGPICQQSSDESQHKSERACRAPHPCVNWHDEACDPAGFFAAEEQYSLRSVSESAGNEQAVLLAISDVPSSAFLAHKILTDSSFAHTFVDTSRPDHRCIHHPGRNAVDSNSLLAMMRGHCSRHLYNGAFRGRVQ
jgi:hypothetical protein